MSRMYPLGKLPADVLAALLTQYAPDDPRVIVGPRPGEDAAVLDLGGDHYLIAKTDPITFATDEIGWYAVNVNANDIAASGGEPAFFMATLLLPGGKTDRKLVDMIFEQINSACTTLEITLVGGHTEVTHGIDRPIIAGMMLGLAEHDRLVSTGGAQPGDTIIVTKGVPIEATAIIAREKADLLAQQFDPQFVDRCAQALHQPGISVVQDARIALNAGRVHALHDPTEGGLLTGLWEMAETANLRLVVEPEAALYPDGQIICEAVGLEPLSAIASGALLIASHPDDASAIINALQAESIAAYAIGRVEDGEAAVVREDEQPLSRPAHDEIAKLFK